MAPCSFRDGTNPHKGKIHLFKILKLDISIQAQIVIYHLYFFKLMNQFFLMKLQAGITNILLQYTITLPWPIYLV